MRLHINPTGARALHALLPAAGWQEFLGTSGPGGDFGFLTEQLDELVVVEEPIMYPGGADPAENHYAADRATLRQVLANGLEGVVRLGSEFVGYAQQPDRRVEARFGAPLARTLDRASKPATMARTRGATRPRAVVLPA